MSISDKDSKPDLDFGSQGHLVAVGEWREGIKLGVWNGSVNKRLEELEYNQDWKELVKMFNLPADCNVVDIGANDGDTTFNLATSVGGKVVAFEMGPTYQLLEQNIRLNPDFDIDIHKLAISDKESLVHYESACKGCNGGITENPEEYFGDYTAQAVRLMPFLLQEYSQEFVDNVCFIKMDTEGHDVNILEDMLTHSWRPPLLWVEWFTFYRMISYNRLEGWGLSGEPDICSQESFRLFKAAENLGYEIFEPKLPLEHKKSCQNKNYNHDLLLIHKDILNLNEKSKSILFASKLVRDEF